MEQPAATIRDVKHLIQVRNTLRDVAYADRAATEIDASSDLVNEMLPPLLELGQDRSYGFRGLLRTSEEWLGGTV